MSVPDVVRYTGRQQPVVTMQPNSKAANGSNIEEEAGIKKGHVNSIASLFSQRLNSSEELRKIPVVTRKPSDRLKRQRQITENPSNLGYTPVGKPTRIQILQKTPEGDLEEEEGERPVSRANARSVEADAPTERRPNFVTKKTKYSSRSAIPATDQPDEGHRQDGKTPNLIKMEEWTVYETLPLNDGTSTMKKKKERENEMKRRREEEEERKRQKQKEDEERRQREKEEEEEDRRQQAEREANERRRRELEERRRRDDEEEELQRRQEEKEEQERERLRKEEDQRRKEEDRKLRRQQAEEEQRRLQLELQEGEEERRRRRRMAEEEKRRRQQEREKEEEEFHRQRQQEAEEQNRRREEEERRRRRQEDEDRRRREKEEDENRRRKEREASKTPDVLTREEWTVYESLPSSQPNQQSRQHAVDDEEFDLPAAYMGASSGSVVGYRRFLEDDAAFGRPTEQPSSNQQKQMADYNENGSTEEERRRKQREERRRRKEDEDRRRAEELEQRQREEDQRSRKKAEEVERRQREEDQRSRRKEDEQRKRERSQSRQREEEEKRRRQEMERRRRQEEKRRQLEEEEEIQQRRERERYAAPSRGPPAIDMLASSESVMGYRRLLDDESEDASKDRNYKSERQEGKVVSTENRQMHSTPPAASRRNVDNKTPEVSSREEWTVYETIPSYARTTEAPIERKREQQRKKQKPEQSAEDVRMEEWTEYHSVPVDEAQGTAPRQDRYDFGHEFLERRDDEGAETRMSTPFKVEEWTEVKKVPIPLEDAEDDSQAASPTLRTAPTSQFDAWGAPALEENPWSFHRSGGRQRYIDPKEEETFKGSYRLNSRAGGSSDDRHDQMQQHQQQLRNRRAREQAQRRLESDDEDAEQAVEEIMPRRRGSDRKKREAEMAAAIRHLESLTDRSESFDLSDSMLDDDTDEEGRSRSSRRPTGRARDPSVSGRRTPATRVSPYQSYHSVNQQDPYSGNVFHSRFNVSRDNPVYKNP